MPNKRSTGPAVRPAARQEVRPRLRRGNAEDAEQARADLLAAAAALFVELGLAGVTIRAVAARAGMSPMSTYKHFASKAELLSGLWESVIKTLHAHMSAAIAKKRGARARQRASLEAYLDYFEERPDHYRLVYMTSHTTDGKDSTRFSDLAVYQDMLALVTEVTRELAAEIGADMTGAKLAGDIRFMMLLGYLNAQLVNRRFPWSERKALRAAHVDQVIATVERVLLAKTRPA